MTKLAFYDHSRHFSTFSYIYPVVSRRSQGVSLGINLNINNACNWRCVYCQVSGLVRGKPLLIDLAKLEYELDYMLNLIIHGDFIAKSVPANLQRLNDICLSGNGESTLSKEFLAVVEIIVKLKEKYHIQDVKTVLITNGSEIDAPRVQKALALIARNNGEVWFKIDSATKKGISKINQVQLSLDGVIKRLQLLTNICKTYIQTCFFKLDGQDPSQGEIDAYIALINQVKAQIAGVFLYSTARNRALPEGQGISQVSEEFLAHVAKRLADIVVITKYYV